MYLYFYTNLDVFVQKNVRIWILQKSRAQGYSLPLTQLLLSLQPPFRRGGGGPEAGRESGPPRGLQLSLEVGLAASAARRAARPQSPQQQQ